MSSQIGVHAAVWSGGWSDAESRHAIAESKAAEYDYIEIMAFDPASIDVAKTRALLADAGLGVTSSLGLNWDNDLSSEDPAVVARGETLLEAVIDCNAALGSKYLVGVIYSALGKYSRPATPRGRANCVAALQRLARRAADSGITLGLEVVNRYETNLFNTAAQALDIVSEIGAPNLGVHLDTYHMNIEEDDFDEPVRLCGDKLVYVHIGESHRGYLGSGNVDFATFFRALGECGYAGPIAFESFSSAVVAPALSNTLGVWRNLWTDNRDLARHAKEFIDRLRAPS
ncbi:MAG: sugar phosphate isomerase/epimerase [Candidatus Velthaea sp.]